MVHLHLFKVMRIKSQWNSAEFEKSAEYNDGTTQTEQDQNYSIREIVSMANRGIAPPMGHEPVYDFPAGSDIPESAFDMSVKESEFDVFDAYDLANKPDYVESQNIEELEETATEAEPTVQDENKE